MFILGKKIPGFPVFRPYLVLATEIADPNLFINLCKEPGPELQHELHLGVRIMVADPGSVLKISLNESYCHAWTLKKK